MLESLGASIESNIAALSQRWPMARKSRLQLNPDECKIPFPAPENIKRICGSEWDPEFFRVSGKIDAQVLVNIAEVYGICDSPWVLEWGVGCGRITRHLPLQWFDELTCFDVDNVNLDWCRFAFHQWNVVFSKVSHDADLFPSFEQFNQYDLIYGFSVFTHLSEHDQIAWLKVLSSICRGLMVFSVHGLRHSLSAEWMKNPVELLQWIGYGFKDSQQQNHDIDGQVPDMYYRDIAHTPAYIREVWGSVVDVLDIIPGAFGHFHDAVVCRRK